MLEQQRSTFKKKLQDKRTKFYGLLQHIRLFINVQRSIAYKALSLLKKQYELANKMHSGEVP